MADKSLEELQTEALVRFDADFEYYGQECLRIKPKVGEAIPLQLNRSQRILHEKLEEQRAKTGWVRVLVLKSRQVGISTYFCARSYYRVTLNKATKAFVLTQEDDTTTALFGMVKRFHEHVPDFVRPIASNSNAKELVFNHLDSSFVVSTAGNKSTGRGQTFQICHGSETSRWPNADEHVAGALQAIPKMPGTEIYIESTANGVNNMFHKMWVAAVKGESEFLPIFIPWFWHEEYEADPPAGWRPPSDFAEYGDVHNLSMRQIFWAFNKNQELATATGAPKDKICWLFRQEYPANAAEAFTSASQSSYIRPELVQMARRRNIVSKAPIILGVDVARGGKDKSALLDRQGRRMGGHICKKFDFGKDTMPLVGEIVKTVREMRTWGTPISKVIVDATGVGGPVFDRLRELLGAELVEGVEFGGQPIDKDRFANKRAEMWHDMMQWFGEPAGVQVPDTEDFQADICAPAWRDPTQKGQNQMTRHRSDGALVMEEKDHIKSRIGFSPDFGDAAAMTFALQYDEMLPMEAGPTNAYTGEGAWML